MDNGASSYRRFLDGDEAAFDDIMQELFHPLVFFINRYVRDLHTAEDLAIDVFSDLVVHRHRYHFKVSLKTYLFMLGRSRALDALRRHRGVTLCPLSEAEQVADDAASPESRVLQTQRQQAIAAALSRLPREQQIAVYLVYLEDMTYEEAARVMKKTKKQVDNLLYRGKQALRVILGKDGADYL